MHWLFDNIETQTAEGANITWIDAHFFTLEFEGVCYHGEVISDQSEDHKLVLKINHRIFHVQKKHALDELIHTLGLDKPQQRKIKEFNSPMPGRVLSLAVKVGDEVSIGSPLLSLEAMKMENTLKANGIGKVKHIFVSVDAIVDKGAKLIEFE